MLGSVILITIFLWYFSECSYSFRQTWTDRLAPVAIAAFIAIGYSYFAAYYRRSSRELKRLDSLLRSLLYSHFAESLSGLATIRAYGAADRFISDDEYFIDLENRALFLTITNQVSWTFSTLSTIDIHSF